MEWLDQILGLSADDLEWYQMALRALVVYFVALLYVRLAGMRSFGTSSAFDVVITITIGAILTRAIAGHYPFFSCLLAAFILAISHRGLAFLSYKSDSIRHVIEGKPVLLFKDGVLLKRNLSMHSIHESDLERTLHEQGIDDYDKVKTIYYEVDGKISVVKKPQ